MDVVVTVEPWDSEVEVNPDLVRRLCVAQFCQRFDMACQPKLLGAGWDNEAYTVGDLEGEAWVIRLPKRVAAVPLMEAELGLLPQLARELAGEFIALPNPQLQGVPEFGYPWRFGGYRLMSGATSCGVDLPACVQRKGAARLGSFLGRLHACADVAGLRDAAASEPAFRRDLVRRVDLVASRVERIRGAESGFWPSEVDRDWVAGRVADLASQDIWAFEARLVHGDLYGRHVLVDAGGAPSGLIDWGDAHLGDPSLDLSLGWTYFAGSARGRFLAAYAEAGGRLDANSLARAQMRALEYGVLLIDFGQQIGDAAIAAVGRTALLNNV